MVHILKIKKMRKETTWKRAGEMTSEDQGGGGGQLGLGQFKEQQHADWPAGGGVGPGARRGGMKTRQGYGPGFCSR